MNPIWNRQNISMKTNLEVLEIKRGLKKLHTHITQLHHFQITSIGEVGERCISLNAIILICSRVHMMLDHFQICRVGKMRRYSWCTTILLVGCIKYITCRTHLVALVILNLSNYFSLLVRQVISHMHKQKFCINWKTQLWLISLVSNIKQTT